MRTNANFYLLMSPRWWASLCAIGLFASIATGHPFALGRENHDRTIVVRLQKSDTPNRIRVRVEYRLEVHEFTVYQNDMKGSGLNPGDYRLDPLQYYAKFTEKFAPIYAARLSASVNKKEIDDFRCISRSQQIEDDNGKALGHLRCDFVFETTFDMPPGEKTDFSFREGTYFLDRGQIDLRVVNETGLALESKTEPDEALRNRPFEQQEPGDDERLRNVGLVLLPQSSTSEPEPQLSPLPQTTRDPRESHDESLSLWRLILQTNYGFWLTMLLALLFGAAHALTPGHGKTLVAAYLVGERGTIWHAGFLGLVTTLTHTGVIIVLAIILTLLPEDIQQASKIWIQNGVGLVMGLIVTCMGFWLLLQRLAGRADHIHLDGGHHHHDPSPSARSLSWWGLVVLGVTGGLIPCWDAVGVLCITVGSNEFWLALPAVLAFSAGLAIVLVLIGILVVQVPRFAEAYSGDGRFVRSLPIISAMLVTSMGLWLCYEAVHGK
jgi:ABC-type nickel/cobalt efflux system permease component RcnA